MGSLVKFGSHFSSAHPSLSQRSRVARAHGASSRDVRSFRHLPAGQPASHRKTVRPKCHICDKHHPHKVCWVLHPECASADWRGPTTFQRYQVYAAVCNLKGVPLKPFMYASRLGVDLQPVLHTPPERASVARPPAAYAREAPSSMPCERPALRRPFAAFTTAALSAPARASSALPSKPTFVRPVVVQHPTLLRVPSPSRSTKHVAFSAPRARHAVPKSSSMHVTAARSAAPEVVRATTSPRAPAVVRQPAVRSSSEAARRAGELREEKQHVPLGVDAADAANSSSDDEAAYVHTQPAAVPMGFAWGWSATYGTSLSCTLA